MAKNIYKPILKQVSVPWLFLERFIYKILHKKPGLKAYFYQLFLVTKGLKDLMNFSELIAQANITFQHKCSQFFTHFNQLLQRDESTFLRASIERLAKRLANRVVEPETLKSMKSIIDLNLNDEKKNLVLQTNSKMKAF